jgi:threonine synthase
MIGITDGQAAASALDAFERAIDRGCPADRSVVLRYRKACRLWDGPATDALEPLLPRTSLGEGMRVVPLFVHRGVTVDVLDSTSLMATHTHKSVDGCVTTAHCLRAGYSRIVFESGGNTGAALTRYASRAGIETFLFLPAENLTLLDAGTFAAPGVHVVAVESAADVKPAAAAFAKREGIPRVPDLAWRHEAAACIGGFVLEHLLSHQPPTHFVQGISAAFAPIGIYRMLEPFRARLGGLPSFLGVQQAANCPMVQAWRGAGDAADAPLPSSTGDLLARVMYDGAPKTYRTFEDLKRLLSATAGDLTTIDRSDFDRWLAEPIDGLTTLEHLAAAGLAITTRHGEIVEKAGLMGLAAAAREIAAGRFPEGSRLLVNVTGGTAESAGQVLPELVIGTGEVPQ